MYYLMFFVAFLTCCSCAPSRAATPAGENGERHVLLSPAEVKAVGETQFLTFEPYDPDDPNVNGCTTDETKCRHYINFYTDCFGSISYIENISSLRTRIIEYSKILGALKKLTSESKFDIMHLIELRDRLTKMANSDANISDKHKMADQIIEEVHNISERIAKRAGFAYDGGCGAPDPDSQEFSFVVKPRPKLAAYILEMDFDLCKSVVDDPFDPNKCDLWSRMRPHGNFLSGRYKYEIIWEDGTFERGFITADDRKSKVVEFYK